MSLTPLAALERRRTIRNYDPNWQIPKDQMDKIMNAAQLSPTACNFQGQDYIVVTNKEKLAKLEKIISYSWYSCTPYFILQTLTKMNSFIINY